MARRRELAFKLRCGKCARELTEANCLFTTCGHLFCADGNCTKLKPGRKTGARCEQCRAQCNANTLDVVLRKDKDAQSVFYICVEEELEEISSSFKYMVEDTNRKMSELRRVLQFRKKQSMIVEGVSEGLNESNAALIEENKRMREKLGMLDKVMAENAELRKGYRMHTRRNTQSMRTSTGASLPQQVANQGSTKPSLHSALLTKDAPRANKSNAPPRHPRAPDVAGVADGARGNKLRAPLAYQKGSRDARANPRARPPVLPAISKPYETTKPRAEAERARPTLRRKSPRIAARPTRQFGGEPSRATTFFTANTSGAAPGHPPPRHGRATDKTSYFQPRRDFERRPAVPAGISKPAHIGSTIGRTKATTVSRPKPTIGASTTKYKPRAPLHDRTRARRHSSPPQVQKFASSRTRFTPGNSKWTSGTAVTGATFKSKPPSRAWIPTRAPKPTTYFPSRR